MTNAMDFGREGGAWYKNKNIIKTASTNTRNGYELAFIHKKKSLYWVVCEWVHVFQINVHLIM